MKITNDPFISDPHFDVLLRHALLEKEKMFNEKTIDQMAQHSFALVNVKDISEAKSNLLVEKLTENFKSNAKKFWLNIFLLILLTGGTIATVLFFTSKSKVAVATKTPQLVIAPQNTPATSSSPVTVHELVANPLPVVNPATYFPVDSVEQIEMAQIIKAKSASSSYVPTYLHIPEDVSMAYEDIPTLTEVQKKQTEKQKLQMMRDISKKRNYGSLPPGKVSVNGSYVSVDGFSIQSSEVTNLEYRTFLNDLLMQGKFEDYLLAKPVSGGWKTVGLPEFENGYSENPAYNNFPAVNMTRKGAELYCDWLTVSMKDAIASKEVKWSGAKNPDFRLPNNTEWIYAARATDTTAIKYPWGRVVRDSVQNTYGCFLCNFNYTISTNHLNTGHVCPGFGKLKQSGRHQAILTTAGMAIDSLVTAPVFSYNPTEWGQYCMVGNVSEMVWTYQADQPGVRGAARSMGGNWNSYVDNAQIEAAEQYVGVTDASPMIGFRPLMNGYFNYAMMKQVKFKH